jgi:prophage DNA circulation protein
MTAATDAFAGGVLALAEALRQSACDPADQIRLMTALAGFAPPMPLCSAALGSAIATAAQCTAALCRRAALVSLANACAAYQPSSADDAQSLSEAVTALYDTESTIAADAGDASTYMALRALGAAVAADLAARGSRLPELVTVTTVEPMPAFALAYMLYRDATRADDLTQRTDAPNPAFLPVEMHVLAS